MPDFLPHEPQPPINFSDPGQPIWAAGLSFSGIARDRLGVARAFHHATVEGESCACCGGTLKVGFPITFTMPCCGEKFTYKGVDDVDLENVPCPCGEPNRWLVFWEDVDA